MKLVLEKSGIEFNELVENHHHQYISCVGEVGPAQFNKLLTFTIFNT